MGVRFPLPAPFASTRKKKAVKTLNAGLFAVALVALLGAADIASAAQCVTVKLLDKNGVVVTTPEPIVGIMVGGRPAIEATIPTDVVVQPGAPAACPAALVKSVRDTFEESCPTEEKRKRAAAVNGVDVTIIAKGCRDAVDALK